MRILVLGGYGLFGGRIVRSLARDAGTTVIVAGRDLAKARRLVAAIEAPRARLETAALDTTDAGFETALAALRPDIAIDTAGPFQARGHRVAEAALAIGAHCIDLADGRDYVRGIAALDARARVAGRWIVSGASSVPGLHAAVIAAHEHRFAVLDEVETAICPGNRTPRGWATTLAILGYVGRRFPILRDGAWRDAHGWQSLRRVRVPGVGARWAARCDVPDLELLPARFPRLRTLEFRAGLELRRMHFGLWLASWAVRLRLLPSMARFARPLFALGEAWQGLGSDVGFIRVDMRGTGFDGERRSLAWSLVAREGDGPQIPATAAVVLARKLVRGELAGGGAKPCLDLFSLDEFLAALEGHAIQVVVEGDAAR
jgi:hypothetical protein